MLTSTTHSHRLSNKPYTPKPCHYRRDHHDTHPVPLVPFFQYSPDNSNSQQQGGKVAPPRPPPPQVDPPSPGPLVPKRPAPPVPGSATSSPSPVPSPRKVKRCGIDSTVCQLTSCASSSSCLFVEQQTAFVTAPFSFSFQICFSTLIDVLSYLCVENFLCRVLLSF